MQHRSKQRKFLHLPILLALAFFLLLVSLVSTTDFPWTRLADVDESKLVHARQGHPKPDGKELYLGRMPFKNGYLIGAFAIAHIDPYEELSMEEYYDEPDGSKRTVHHPRKMIYYPSYASLYAICEIYSLCHEFEHKDTNDKVISNDTRIEVFLHHIPEGSWHEYNTEDEFASVKHKIFSGGKHFANDDEQYFCRFNLTDRGEDESVKSVGIVIGQLEFIDQYGMDLEYPRCIGVDVHDGFWHRSDIEGGPFSVPFVKIRDGQLHFE